MRRLIKVKPSTYEELKLIKRELGLNGYDLDDISFDLAIRELLKNRRRKKDDDFFPDL